MKRLFNAMLFCGDPQTYYQHLGMLHAQLADALNLMGGLQQPSHSISEEHARMDAVDREHGWKEVEVCAQDIVCALLGPRYVVRNVDELIAEGMAVETARDMDQQLLDELSDGEDGRIG